MFYILKSVFPVISFLSLRTIERKFSSINKATNLIRKKKFSNDEFTEPSGKGAINGN